MSPYGSLKDLCQSSSLCSVHCTELVKQSRPFFFASTHTALRTALPDLAVLVIASLETTFYSAA